MVDEPPRWLVPSQLAPNQKLFIPHSFKEWEIDSVFDFWLWANWLGANWLGA